MKLVDFTTTELFSYFIVLCRIGSSLLVMPGVAEGYISSRVRLSLGLAIAFYAQHILRVNVPLPDSVMEIFLIILSEVSIGVSFGLISRIFLSALYVAGHAISASIGLSSATMFDHSQGDQGALIGNFLGIIGLAIVLHLNLHIAIIDSLIQSYSSLKIGVFFAEFQSFFALITKVFLTAWNVGLRLAAPFIVTSLVIYLGAGVLSRLMPQLQVFFLLLPAQILIGFFLLLTMISVGTLFFIDEYKTFLTNFMSF